MSRSLRLLTIAASMCFASSAWADLNDKDGKWRGLTGASLSMSSGNTEAAALLLNLNLSRQTENEKTSIRATANQARSDANGEQATTANKWSLSGQQDIDLTTQWFAFSKLGFDADRLIELKLRTSVAGGLGFHVIESETHNFDVFGGLSYTHKHYRKPQTIQNETDTRFSNVGLLIGEESSHKLNDSVSLKQRLEFYPGLTGDKTKLANFTGSMNVSMSKTLSLSVGITSTYNSKVPPGVKKTDTTVFTGLNMLLGG